MLIYWHAIAPVKGLSGNEDRLWNVVSSWALNLARLNSLNTFCMKYRLVLMMITSALQCEQWFTQC